MTDNRQKTPSEELLEWLSDPELKLPDQANAKVNALYHKVMNQQVSALHNDLHVLTLTVNTFTTSMRSSMSSLDERLLKVEKFKTDHEALVKKKEDFEQKKWFQKSENRAHILTTVISTAGAFAGVVAGVLLSTQ